MRDFAYIPAGFAAWLGVFLFANSASEAGVVTTLPAVPTSNHTTIGNLPTWNNNGDQEDATFSAYIDFSANSTPGSRQLIWESGGRINGSSLIYENNNLLRLRTLQSGLTSELTWQLTADQIAAGDVFVSWVIDLGSDELRLVMDEVSAGAPLRTVAMAAYTDTDWTGPGVAGFGDSTTRVGGYPPPFQFFPDAFTSGTINTTQGLNYYQDISFLPTPVPEPLGTLAGVAAIGFTCFRRRRPEAA